jgi:hypothetical protein
VVGLDRRLEDRDRAPVAPCGPEVATGGRVQGGEVGERRREIRMRVPEHCALRRERSIVERPRLLVLAAPVQDRGEVVERDSHLRVARAVEALGPEFFPRR